MGPKALDFFARVEHLSSQGLGTVRDQAGRTYFVRAVWPGDEGIFRATEEREDRYQFAELLKLEKPSEERREIPCPHFGVGEHLCYGCPWILANEDAQAKRKIHRLRYAFERVGLDTTVIQDLWRAPEGFSYRSRAQFKTDGLRLGYAGLKGLAIAEIESCLTLTPRMREKFRQLKAELPQTAWQPEPPHIWNYLDIDEADHPLVLNKRRPFQQVHQQQNLRMREWVKRETEGDRILELFSGSGNLTEVLVREGRTIEAFEVGKEAVEGLEAKHLPGVSAARMDLYKPKALHALKSFPPETLVVNPPRAGLLGLTRLTKFHATVKSIVYVSCDIQTLVSDLQKFRAQGFRLTAVQPVDQMPQTPHLEVLVRLDR